MFDSTSIPVSFYMSEYRMIFVDARMINVRYLRKCGRGDAIRMPLRFQIVRQWLGIVRNYSSFMMLSRGHALIKQLDFVEAVSMRLLSYVNVEFFARKTCTLFCLVQTLKRFHATHGGRTEIRERGCFLYALDLATKRGNRFDSYLFKYANALRELGVREVSLHAGKFIPSSLHPLERISLEDMANMAPNI